MQTPIADFLEKYEDSGMIRFHMPGHKGKADPYDITEVNGADSLYEADGIIAESEHNASLLFGSQRTCYSTEGSSQCIRAMLYLALMNRPAGTPPVIV
ncbi:MAG: amino acid decarboxylase, partial [Christensenellaceae bacterium]|nr:amino acid decarboxylase [Christensenellaceae bacterium]